MYTIKDGKICSGPHEFGCFEFEIAGQPMVAYNDWFFRDVLPIWEEQGVVDRLTNKVESYLEIGVNCGQSFAYVLNKLVTQEGSATGIDPYQHGSRDRVNIGLQIAEQLCEQNLKPWAGSFHIIKETSQLCLMRLLTQMKTEEQKPPFDFIYVDGDHYAPAALLDMLLAWELLQPDGIMIVDDFNRQFVNGAKQVRPACMAFFDCMSNQIEPFFMTQRQIGFIKRLGRKRK